MYQLSKAEMVMAKLRVYGWLSFRAQATNNSRQTREVCAASSKAEVARLAGKTRHTQLFNLCETANPEEVKVALATPRTVFWQELYRRDGVWQQ